MARPCGVGRQAGWYRMGGPVWTPASLRFRLIHEVERRYQWRHSLAQGVLCSDRAQAIPKRSDWLPLCLSAHLQREAQPTRNGRFCVNKIISTTRIRLPRVMHCSPLPGGWGTQRPAKNSAALELLPSTTLILFDLFKLRRALLRQSATVSFQMFPPTLLMTLKITTKLSPFLTHTITDDHIEYEALFLPTLLLMTHIEYEAYEPYIFNNQKLLLSTDRTTKFCEHHSIIQVLARPPWIQTPTYSRKPLYRP